MAHPTRSALASSTCSRLLAAARSRCRTSALAQKTRSRKRQSRPEAAEEQDRPRRPRPTKRRPRTPRRPTTPEATSRRRPTTREGRSRRASSRRARSGTSTTSKRSPGRRYFFVGLRYRGNVIPQFMLNLFVDEGKTIYTNMIGVEFDLRKDGFSLIPALSYHELGTGDILFKQKNTNDIPGNYSLVNSGMKVVYATRRSALVDEDLEERRVRVRRRLRPRRRLRRPREQLGATDAERAARRPTRQALHAVRPSSRPGTGCNPPTTRTPSVDKVNGYKEPAGSAAARSPPLFPWIAVPQIGLRFKPIKNFVARLGIGFALTGFWFGLSGQYGLEQTARRSSPAPARPWHKGGTPWHGNIFRGARRTVTCPNALADVSVPARYEPMALLGKGGGGEVWAVRDRVTGRRPRAEGARGGRRRGRGDGPRSRGGAR